MKGENKKCDGCKTADAEVYFSVVTGKFKSSRKRYCRACAKSERLRLVPTLVGAAQAAGATHASLLGLVRQELEKSATAKGTSPVVPANETSDSAVKRLEGEMNAAIAKEDYEKAAVVRDKIAALQGKDAKKGSKKTGGIKPSGTSSP